MFYKNLLILILLFLSTLSAQTFDKINPKPNKIMLQNQLNAKTCASPIDANETISQNFKYGCFCGRGYPALNNPKTDDFRKLNKQERLKIIESYALIKPYDDIDAVCKQHDICYLYQGKKAKVCNEAIYDELHVLVDKFKLDNHLLKQQQCQYLTSDIASVFKTVFASADDEEGIFSFGALLFNTSLTIANKTFEESIDTLIEQEARYPQDKKRCLVPKGK